MHPSGGVGIGGVLEPLQANPTIIEDGCFIGARSEIVEGVIVEAHSVISDGRLHWPEHENLRPRHRAGHLWPRALRFRRCAGQLAFIRRFLLAELRGHRERVDAQTFEDPINELFATDRVVRR